MSRWLCAMSSVVLVAAAAEAAWFKGNTHAHSFWSDGEAAPEHAVAWYKDHGYHFLAMTEHHVLPEGERYFSIADDSNLTPAMAAEYEARFGPGWVQRIVTDSGSQRMRLKTFAELDAKFGESGRFLLLQGQEITTLMGAPHVNAVNLHAPIKGLRGGDNADIASKYFEAVQAQAGPQRGPTLAHLNHPNWSNGFTVEDALATRGLRYFEVYNAQNSVRNGGVPDQGRPSTDQWWDIVLSVGLARDPSYRLYGLGTDDAHVYHAMGGTRNNPGRGWVMVRAESLTWPALHAAFERGDFYASSGVTFEDIAFDGSELRLQIAPQPGVAYTTHFIGTRKSASLDARTPGNGPGASAVYSEEIGATLAKSDSLTPVYRLDGSELYVRARVTSSKTPANPVHAEDKEQAWTQPVMPR